jgi:hypothetical protein
MTFWMQVNLIATTEFAEAYAENVDSEVGGWDNGIMVACVPETLPPYQSINPSCAICILTH